MALPPPPEPSARPQTLNGPVYINCFRPEIRQREDGYWEARIVFLNSSKEPMRVISSTYEAHAFYCFRRRGAAIRAARRTAMDLWKREQKALNAASNSEWMEV